MPVFPGVVSIPARDARLVIESLEETDEGSSETSGAATLIGRITEASFLETDPRKVRGGTRIELTVFEGDDLLRALERIEREGNLSGYLTRLLRSVRDNRAVTLD
jgi:hypothetical protein